MFRKKIFKNNKLFTFLAVLVLLIFFHYTSVLKPVENFVYYIFLPIQSNLYKYGNDLSHSWNSANLNQKELIYQNQTLKKQNQKLIIEQSKFFETKAENKLLRKQLNFLEFQQESYLISRVTGNNLQNNIYGYILDKGLDDGVKVGQAVITGEGVIVGKIYKVFSKRSEVLLLTDNKNVLAVVVQNKDNSQGIIEGDYGLTMKLDLIPQNEQVDIGDLIITSGIESLIPRGLIVGIVEQVESEVNELFQTANVSPIVDYKKLNILTIILSNDE